MACSLSNWAGSGTAPKIIADSGAKTSMDDRTFVSKVYDYLYSLDINGYKNTERQERNITMVGTIVGKMKKLNA